MKLSELCEARQSGENFKYSEKKVKKGKGADAVEIVDRVIVEISGKDSAKFTVLSKKYKDFKDSAEALKKKQDELNEELKTELIELFDAEDEIFTRAVETCSMTITLAKKSEDSVAQVTDYEKVVKALIAMVPEVTAKVDELIKSFTVEETKKAKSPALRVDVKESIIGDWLKKTKAKIAAVYKSIMSWTQSYDEKLKEVKASIAAL